MIRLVTGPLGTGKSAYGVRKAVEAITTGKMVVTNFAMEPDWIDQAVRHGRLRKRSSRLNARVDRAEGRYLRVRSLEELMRVRVRQVEPFIRTLPGGKVVLREGSCVVILDEAHRWMNARSWSEAGRKEILNFFALARKMGFDVYLLAQRAENVDVQVRSLFEDHIRLNNLRNSARLLGVRVIPFNVFIAGWRNHNYPDEVIKTERYRLGWWKRLYDTMDTESFGGDASLGSGAIWLPVDDEDRTAEQDAPAAGAGLPAPAAAPSSPTRAAAPSGIQTAPLPDFPEAPDPSL